MSKPTTKCRACNGTGQAPLTDTYSEVLALFRFKPSYTSRDVADDLGLSPDNACKRLNELVRTGFLSFRTEAGKRGRIYRRTTGGRKP